MKLLNNKFFPVAFFLIIVLIFFWQFFSKGLLPIPADTIVGLYHPYRDLYAKDYPRGIPFKNFLITDPVRQQYPWKNLSINLIKKNELPLWNPYSFSGTPLLANFQSAVFYPFNILFFILPFNIAWSLLIVLEVFLGMTFMYLFLNNLKLNKWASFLGSFVFAFSGYSTAWLEWGNIIHTALWLPLILLSIDKMLEATKAQRSKIIWEFIFILSLISSFFAGHLQIFFYLFGVAMIYLFYRWIEYGKNVKTLVKFVIFILLFIIITSVQWLPTLNLINESARNIDQNNWQKLGWFIPWQNLLQLFVPDFFGNPATLNYWGIFNYGEFVSYVGVAPILFSIYALFFRKDKRVLLFGSLFFLGLIFSLPTFIAKIPYLLNIPFISTAQPTRLVFVIDFTLAILSALGLDLFIKKRKNIKFPIIFLLFSYSLIWIFVFLLNNQNQLRDNLLVSRSNLIFPSVIFIVLAILIIVFNLKKINRFRNSLIVLIIFLACFDLLRFAWKFTPFTNEKYLFPNTKTLEFLKKQKSEFRIMTTDPRIFSPNFSVIYGIQSVDGYDPLYLQRYGELIAALERDKPDISGPFGFDRIITPHNIDSKLINLLGVKYILSLSDISDKNFQKIFSEGETQVYENMNVLPRAFFAEDTIFAQNKNDAIKSLFTNQYDLEKNAVVENLKDSKWTKGSVEISRYAPNRILLKTENKGEGFLVLADSFYPSWHARIDGNPTKIYRTDYNFRGIVVPQGKHEIEFYITLF